MDTKVKAVSLLRNLYRELRPLISSAASSSTTKSNNNETPIVGHDIPVHKTATWKYIRKLITRSSSYSQEERRNLFHVGETYLTYLRSSRQYSTIMINYRGKGERTVLDTATIVGFKLPESSTEEVSPEQIKKFLKSYNSSTSTK